jgi:hypothetical protein
MINKKLLLLIFGLIMTTQMIFSQVPSYVPTNGLVGYWPFNGNANDASGNNLNGTVTGATLTTDRFGNANCAYNFDGISNKIEVNDNSQLQLTTFTVSLWVNATSGYSLVNKSNWSDGSLETFNIGLGTELLNSSIKMNSNCFAGQGWNNITTNTGSLYNSWKHIVVVFNGSNVKHFVNGVQVNSQPLVGLMDTCFGGKLKFGAWWQSGPDYLNGKLDDIGIWNRALTQQEITNMYNGVNYSDTCNAVSGSLVNGLVAYYPFCGNANDQSGNGNNGTVNGATLVTDRFGNNNSAYDFDGNLNTYVNVPLQETLEGNKSFSCWIKLPFNFINPYCNFITAKNQTVTLPNDYLSINGNHPSYVTANIVGRFFDGKTGIGLNSTINLNNNIWHHIVLTHNYNLQQAKLFIDGVLIETLNSSSFSTNSLIDRFVFGGDLNTNTSANATLFGQLDDIGIWNRALTQQEITQLFSQNQCQTNITVTDTLIINVGQLSYTNPVTYANNITIYPNPANTQVNISFNNITYLIGGNINIVNSLGQQVATTPITLSGTNTTMALNTWGGTGLYFVQILNAQGIVVDVKKIILQ